MSPTAPAASRKSARPPRMISGSGNDVAPPGELFLIAPGIGPAGCLLPGSGVVGVDVVSWVSGVAIASVGNGVFGVFVYVTARASDRWISFRALVYGV